jgi:ketosteroid isomerase-like protein
MTDHPNAALVRTALESLEAGEFEAQMDLLDDEVVWHEIGNPDPVRGKQALIERMSPGGADFEIKATVHDVVANDEHAIALVDAVATRGGRTLEYRTAEIAHIRNGKIIERWAFSDDTERIVAFFR